MSFDLNRRQMLRYTGAFGGLLLLGGVGRTASAQQPASSISPMIRLDADGTILIYNPSPEMGQGTDTAVPMLLAEELDADFSTVRVADMPLMLKPGEDGNVTWAAVPQFAGGSTSIKRNWTLMRHLGAVTRELLVRAAAVRWQADPAVLRTEKSQVINPATGARLTYGALAGDAAATVLPEGFEPKLKPRRDWQLIGRPQRHVANRDIVTGKAVFGIDAAYPGVKTTVIARCPHLDGDVKSVDDTAARAVPGVRDVVIMPRPALDKNYTYLAAGVAVVADTFWAAKTGADALKIEWDKGPYQDESTASFDAHCAALLDGGSGQVVRDDGNVDKANETARVIRRRYRQPYVSHAQLEVQNCTAHVRADGATVIGPFQSPSGASRMAAALTGLDRLAINVQVTRLGGGFGRRLTSDHVAEAVFVSQACGLPVKVIWTREDDLSHDFYRPAGHHEIVAGFDEDGGLVSWHQRVASASKYYRRDTVAADKMWTPEIYPDDFPAGLVDNLRCEYFAATSGMPRGSWRAPAHTANAFVVQSFLDEVAAELGEDPLALRLRLLGEGQEFKYEQHGGPVFDTGRLKGVLEMAARMAEWGKAMPDGHAQGIAGHFTFGGYCAQVAEVERRADGSFKVHRVFAAVDVGTVVNPAGVIKQAEGGIVDGMSAAFGQEILVDDGQVMTRNFDTYHMLRMADAPTRIDVGIVDSDKEPSGMGEMSIPVIAPAVMNALARAGGPRIRHLPVKGA